MQCPCVTLRIRRDVREKLLKILNKFTSKQFAVVSLSLFFVASIITVIVAFGLTPAVWIDSIRAEHSFQLNAQLFHFFSQIFCVTAQIEQIFDKLIAFFNLYIPHKILKTICTLGALKLLRPFESFVRISIEIANCEFAELKFSLLCRIFGKIIYWISLKMKQEKWLYF